MSEAVAVTSSNFEQEVGQSTLPVLVDFWAPWCQPCKMLMPTIDALTAAYDGRLRVAKVNLDEAPELADRFKVRGIPHLVLVRGAEAQVEIRGRNRTRIAAELDALLQEGAR